MKFGDIKSRVMLFTLTLFVVSIWGLSYFASRMLRDDMQHVLSDQQLSTASFIAGDITDQLTYRIKALEMAAPFHAKSIGSPAATQTLLSSRVTLLSLFNGDVAVSDLSGTVIAASTPALVGINFMDRDYLVSALKDGKSTISKPLVSKVSKAPVFVIVVPIRNVQGKIVGALAGVTDLAKENFLDNIGRNHYGQSGTFLVVSRSLRQIIAASAKERVMESAPAPGTIPLIDRFIEGFDGSAILVNPKGVEVLQSVKAIPLANWYVAVQLPVSEAFRPIYALHHRLLFVTALLTLLTGGLTWLLLQRQLQPMVTAANRLAALGKPEQSLQTLPVTREDEIGEMLHAVNRLITNLSDREVALRESERKFRTLIEWAPQPMVVHRDGKIIYTNPAGLKLIGAKSLDEMRGSSILNWVHPSCHAMVIQRAAKALQNDGPIEPTEEIFIRTDGRSIDVEVQSTKIDFDGTPAVHVAVRDITDRKHAMKIAQQLEAVVRCSIDAFWITNAEGRFVEANDAACSLVGYAREELLKLHISDIEADESPEETAAHIRQIVENGHLRFEARHKRKDGAIIDVDVSVIYVESIGEKFFAFLRDISDRKQLENQLRQNANVFRFAGEGIVITDVNGNIVDVNAAFADITGYTRDEALGKNARFLNSGRQDDTFYEHMWSELLHHGYWSGEVWNRRKNGEVYPELLTISSVVNGDGTTVQFVAIFSDITERKSLEEKVYRLAFYDALTQLPNRRLLDDRLKQAMSASKRSGKYGALFMLDLDNFKPLNDQHGHPMGDLLLVEVAKRLVACVRETDTVARFGGDEFVVVLGELENGWADSARQASDVAEKIRMSIQEPYRLLPSEAGQLGIKLVEHHCSASIGVVLFLNHEASQSELLTLADKAMYEAKGAGRNSVKLLPRSG